VFDALSQPQAPLTQLTQVPPPDRHAASWDSLLGLLELLGPELVPGTDAQYPPCGLIGSGTQLELGPHRPLFV